MTDEHDAIDNATDATPARIAADERAARRRPAPNALARWSERRRRVAEAERGPGADAFDGAPSEAQGSDAHEPDALAANRAAAEAIDVEALGPGADVSALLREGVPDVLRRTALRALWRSDPVFANVDRLCDYDDDFRDPKMVLETLQSAWQAGRGYLFAEEANDGAHGEADGKTRDGADEDETSPHASSRAEPGLGRPPLAVRPPVDVAGPVPIGEGRVAGDRDPEFGDPMVPEASLDDGSANDGTPRVDAPDPRAPGAPSSHSPSLRARLGL